MHHIFFTQLLWKHFLTPGMVVFDATMGNGNDTLFLANAVLTKDSGWVHAFDIQEEAIAKTALRLEPFKFKKRVTLHHASHEILPPLSPSLIVYNLGYLPHGDPSVTTRAQTTVESLKSALEVLLPQGMITITLYAGHPEGVEEKAFVLSFLATLKGFSIYHYASLQETHKPSVISLRRKSLV